MINLKAVAMYDNVKFWVSREHFKEFNNIHKHIYNTEQIADIETGEVTYKGGLRNLKVSVKSAGLYIVGSWSKYLYGSNEYTLTRAKTREFIDTLSDTLHTDISNGRVFSLEFGANYELQHPFKTYTAYLGQLSRYKRTQTEQTIYYKTNTKNPRKELIFYDKGDELRTQGLNPVNEDCNLLRYEMRFRHSIETQLNKEVVRVADLADFDTYRRLQEIYLDNFLQIEKIGIMDDLDITTITTAKGASDYLFNCLLSVEGVQERLLAEIDRMKANRVFKDPKYYSRLKRKYIRHKNAGQRENPYIDELENAIKTQLEWN